MKKPLSFNALVAALLIGIAADNAWPDDTSPGGSAVQAPAAIPGFVPGGYPPPPAWGGYPQQRQQPSQWPLPSPGYGQLPPYYPPYGPYRAAPAAPAAPGKNSLSADLKQAREQLSAKSTELDSANGQLAALQAALQAARETLLHAQSENTLSSRQLATAVAQADTLRNMLAELTARLESQQATLLSAVHTRAAEQDSVHSAPAGRDEPLAATQAEAQNAQQAQTGTTSSGQQLSTAREQAAAYNNELLELKAQLKNQKTTLQDTGRTLAAVIAERDGVLADMSAVVAERDRLQKALATCRQELTLARSASTAIQTEINTPK